MTEIDNQPDTTSNTPSVKSIIDKGSVSLLQIRVLVICLILNMLDGFDILAMAFTLSPIAEEWGTSMTQMGSVMSASLFGMMVGALGFTPFSDVLGRRKMMLICLTFVAASMGATAYANDIWTLIFLRAITGLGIGTMLANLTSLVSEFAPERRKTLMVLIMQAGYPSGAVIGGVIVANTIVPYGWQSVFIGGGLATFLMVLIVVFFLPESLDFLATKRPSNALQRINTSLSKMKLQTLDSLPKLGPQETKKRFAMLALFAPENRKNTLLLCGAFVTSYITLYFLLSWIPKLIVNAGLPLDKGIYISAAMNLGAVAGIITMGLLSFKQSLTKMIFLFVAVGAVLMGSFGFMPTVVSVLMVLTVLIGFFTQGGFTALYAVGAHIYPTDIRTTGVGWAMGTGRIGAIIAPFLGGVLIDAGVSMRTNFVLFCVPIFIAGAMAYKIKLKPVE